MSVYRPDGPRSPSASPRWIDRWLAACSELAELERSNPMTDAVIDEIDGRMIRIGDQWLADFASCNYLGFDLEREIIAAVPEYLEKWGTHPSWSRMLGSPVLYPQIEERLIELLGCEDALVIPTITLIHLSVIPVLAGDGTIFVDNRAHKTIYDGCQFASARGATVKRFRFEDPDDLEQLLRAGPLEHAADLHGRRQQHDRERAGPERRSPGSRARYDAILYVDDAHGFGVIGERAPDEPSPYGIRGNSIVRYCDESYDGIVLVAGFSKSYSSLAAFVACPTELKELLKTAAPPYLYSGPSPIASLATVLAGFDVNEERGDAIRADLWRKTDQVLELPRPPRRPHAEPLGLPDHRGPARAPRGHRRGRALPLRQRHLRDARRLPARAEERGRASGSRSRPRTRRPRSSSSSTSSASSRTRSTSGRRGRRNTRRERARPLRLARTCLDHLPRRRRPPHRGVPLVPAAQGRTAPSSTCSASPSSVAIAVGIYLHRPKARAAWVLFIVGSFLFFAGDLYTYSYPKLMGVEVEFPSHRGRDLPDGLPGARGGPARARPTAKPAGRPRRRDRLADHLGRHRAALVGLPRRAEHPPLRPDDAREGGLGRLPARRHPAPRRRSPPRGRQRASAHRPSTSWSGASSRCSPSTPPTRTRC